MDLISKPRGKSVVWLYFGFKADENGLPLNSGEAICRLCRKVVIAKGNTTNLRSHLRRRHPTYFFESIGPVTSTAFSETQVPDLNHEDFLEDSPRPQSPSSSNYIPDAAIPPGEPWLRGGPTRAILSLPSCLRLCRETEAERSDLKSYVEVQSEIKVLARSQLQTGVMFGPFVGEVSKSQMPINLKYTWAIRDEASFIFVDASDENKSNWMRFVTYTSNEQEHNLVVFQFYRHIYYKVTQPVSEGTELKVWIGKDYATLLGLGLGENMKCEIGQKETALRLLQDIQLVTLPETNACSVWSDQSQSQSPMPVISDVATMPSVEAAVDGGGLPVFPSSSLQSSHQMEKYDFMPGTEKLLSNPGNPSSSPWYFFGMEPDPTGRPLDRNTAVCKLCMEHVNCAGGGVVLQNHLTSKHHIRFREKDRNLTTGQQRIQSAMPLGGLGGSFPSVMPSQLASAITNFLIVDLLPPVVIEGDGFRQLLQTLLPPYRELPLSCQVETLLRDHHTKEKTSLSLLLSGESEENQEIVDYTAPIEFEPKRSRLLPGGHKKAPDYVALSVDVWLHTWQGNAERHLTLWAHYIDDAFALHNLALETQRLKQSGEEKHGRQTVETQAKAMAQRWGIAQPNLLLLGMEDRNSKKPAEMTPDSNSSTIFEKGDSESSEAQSSERGLVADAPPAVPCFFNAAQSCIEEVMSHRPVSSAISYFQQILSELFFPAMNKGSFHRHTEKLLAKTEQEKFKLWARRRPAWDSLFAFLSTLVKHKNLLCGEANGEEETAEWKLAEDLCLVLKPLDVACRTLASEAFPRLSLVKPILTGLLTRHLAPRPADLSPVLKEVKMMMRKSLTSSYRNPAVNRILCVACSLDPQFRGLSFMEEQEQTDTYNWLKAEAVRIVKEKRRKNHIKSENQMKRIASPESPEPDCDYVRRSKRIKDCPPINFKDLADEDSEAGEMDDGDSMDTSYRAGLSGMEFLLGDLFCSAPRSSQSTAEELVDMEMSVFKADKGAWLGVEPLQWWRMKAVQFPLLASVARAYLAAPAVAGNAAQDFSRDAERATSSKRSNIPPESLDAILFLHLNQIKVAESGVVKNDDRSNGNEMAP